jgi:hypothetical protein
MRTDEQLEALRTRYNGKIGSVEYNGHELVFCRPTRDQAREYRRKMESAVEKMDALDQLAQVTIIAFDAEEDRIAARTTFTTLFLERYPLATSNPKLTICLSALAGLVEEEHEQDLGKGVRIKGPPREPSARA